MPPTARSAMIAGQRGSVLETGAIKITAVCVAVSLAGRAAPLRVRGRARAARPPAPPRAGPGRSPGAGGARCARRSAGPRRMPNAARPGRPARALRSRRARAAPLPKGPIARTAPRTRARAGPAAISLCRSSLRSLLLEMSARVEGRALRELLEERALALADRK